MTFQLEKAKDVHGLGFCSLDIRPILSSVKDTDENVLKDREGLKRSGVLIGTRYANTANLIRLYPGNIPAFEPDAAGSREKGAADQVKHRGFPGPIGPDNPGDAALFNLEIDAGQGRESTKCLTQLLHH